MNKPNDFHSFKQSQSLSSYLKRNQTFDYCGQSKQANTNFVLFILPLFNISN